MPSASHNPKDAGTLALLCCPECGYNLEGSPSQGVCTECGWEFASDDVVLYGSAERDGRAGRIDLIVAAFGILIVLGFVMWHEPPRDGPSFGSVILGIGLLGLLMRVFFLHRAKRARGKNPGPWQLRFGRRGFGQRFGIGHMKLTPWGQMIRIEVFDNGGGCWAFVVVRWIDTLDWKLRRCKAAAESVPVIQVLATTDEIRELMERIATWMERKVGCEYSSDHALFCVRMGGVWPDHAR